MYRHFGRSLLMAVITSLMLQTVVLADVSTNKWDYSVGETVQITGDGMAAGEDVSVDVGYPDGTLAQRHVVVADGAGNFADSYYLADGSPGGIYTVTATGATSGTVFTTTFDPAVEADCLQFDTPGHLQQVTPTVTAVTGGIKVDWTDQCTDETNYIVQRSTDGSTWTDIATLAAGSVTYTDTTAVCDTQYYYRIEATHVTTGHTADPSFSNSSAAISWACVVTPPPPVAFTTCHYHVGSTDTGTTYTNKTLLPEANIPANTFVDLVVHCTFTTNTPVTNVKVQGGVTVSKLQTQPTYSFLSDSCASPSTNHTISISKNSNVVTSKAASLPAGSCDVVVLIHGAKWKTAVGSGTSISGGWSTVYSEGPRADAPETPLTINVVP